MQVFRGRAAIEPTLGRRLRAPAIAIGNFDGVHRGHQALLARARELAAASGGEAGVLTFDPHPARYFAPALAPPSITTLDRRLELLAEAGLDFVVVEPFDQALATMEAERFVEEVLAGALGARHVVVGYDFSFGRARRGNTEMLARWGSALGIDVLVVPPVTAFGVTCSSTKVREFVLEGRVEGAALVLGRPFEIDGVVERGAARGRTIGFPTANVRASAELLPRPGIYAGRAVLLAANGVALSVHRAAISVGTNPTFVTAGAVTVEAYLLDFSGDLYDRRLRLEFLAHLRSERRFDSVEALVAQMHQDVARTRELVTLAPPPPAAKAPT